MAKTYITEIKAISPTDGEMHTYSGPHVPGATMEEATQYCEENGLGYCRVVGELGTAVINDNPERVEG